MTGRIVYVVDDEEPIRRSSQLMLRLDGYEAVTFETGLAFIGALPALAPGAVLLDLRMPEVDGIEVQRRLRAERDWPVVVMSGHGDLSVAVPAMRGGAIAFLEKPFSKAALGSVLAAAFLKLEDEAAYRAHLGGLAARAEALPEMERAVLSCMARGLANDSIAAEVGAPVARIEIARARMLERLGAEGVTDALRMAFAAELGSGRS